MAPAERLVLLGDMRQHAPGRGIRCRTGRGASHLTVREWDKLMVGLELAGARLH